MVALLPTSPHMPAPAAAALPAPGSGAGGVTTDEDCGENAHLDAAGRPRIVERRFTVAPEHAGQRLDHYLKRQIPRLSRTRLQAIIRTQLVRTSDGPCKPHSPVRAGETLTIRRTAQPEPPCPRNVTVLYRDDHVWIVDKPAGLPVHASAKFYFNTLARVLAERFPGEPLQMCHRLDRETSGCLVLARGREAAARLKGAFARRRVDKTYRAVVHGDPAWQTQRIELPLGLVNDPRARIGVRMEVRDDALPAVTEVEVEQRAGAFALVRCHPITGRQHQIRAHLAAIGHPIVGDKLYAHGDEAFAAYCDGGLTPDLLERFLLARQALHAASITIAHPATGAPLTVESPLPADLASFLSQHRTAEQTAGPA